MRSQTLYDYLLPSGVSYETLHKDYHGLLGLVKEMIGVIPDCDPLLEIWPISFRTYNLLIPNFLNLPQSLITNRSLNQIKGLAMFESSKGAECSYCMAHTCSFSLRRGIDKKSIQGALSPKEKAVANLGQALGKMPLQLKKSHCLELAQHYNENDIEEIILSISMIGFLNKFMDNLGMRLEEGMMNDVGQLLIPTGWTPPQNSNKHKDSFESPNEASNISKDNLFSIIRLVRFAPNATQLEKKWMKGIPNKYTEAVSLLKSYSGYDFPILKKIKSKRVVRTLTTIIRDNLSDENTTIGLDTKCMISWAFAQFSQNEELIKMSHQMRQHLAAEYTDESIEAIAELIKPSPIISADICRQQIKALQEIGINQKQAAALVLSQAASPSPTDVNEMIVNEVATLLDPVQIIETITWVSFQQCLHRLFAYYIIRDQ